MKLPQLPDLGKYIDMIVKFVEDAVMSGYGFLFAVLVVLLGLILFFVRR